MPCVRVMLAAGLDGLDNKIEPGRANKENMYRMSEEDLEGRRIGVLPFSLKDAVDDMEKDDVILEALGREFLAPHQNEERGAERVSQHCEPVGS